MADVIDYKIYGDDLQMVEIALDPEETVRAEPGAMVYMSNGIKMETNTGGGVFKGLQRAMAGESFFISHFTQKGEGKGHVAFAAPTPGKIIPVDLSDFGGEVLCQRSVYLCSAKGIDVEMAFTKKIGAGFFGGEGFILQKLKGDGMAFVQAGGYIVEKTLGEGETLRVDTGSLVMFEKTVSYDIKMVGGVGNMFFGGEGLFHTHLTGPGRVYLQSMPISRLAATLAYGGRR